MDKVSRLGVMVHTPVIPATWKVEVGELGFTNSGKKHMTLPEK
jgi:hypothetical protein